MRGESWWNQESKEEARTRLGTDQRTVCQPGVHLPNLTPEGCPMRHRGLEAPARTLGSHGAFR